MKVPPGYKLVGEKGTDEEQMDTYGRNLLLRWTTDGKFFAPPFRTLAMRTDYEMVRHTVSSTPCRTKRIVRCFVRVNGKWYEGPRHPKGKCPLCKYRKEGNK